MQRDLGTLRVETLIVHEIPQHYMSHEEGGPTLSEIDSHLTVEVRNFFREKITDTLAHSAYAVEFDVDSTSPIPNLVREYLEGVRTHFVRMSHTMAHHLYQCQGGVSPAGLLTVVSCALGTSSKALAILKLEKEEGARVQQIQRSGKLTFDVSHIRDLMLTSKTKVFKVGLFVRAKNRVDGMVCDQQRAAGTTVAQFFLGRFLGCRLKERPEITTRRFMDVVQDFINEDIEDSVIKARYQVALLAELSNTNPSISPEAFANTNLKVGDRKVLMQRLRAAEIVGPSFRKDTSLIKTHLERIQMSFESGIAVLARPEHVGEELKITKLDGGRTKVEIEDILKQMRGKR